jgi:hypothetical protein
MVALGLLLGIVGTDIFSSVDRFCFGRFELTDGIGFVIIGLSSMLWGLVKRSNLPKLRTLRERNEAAMKLMESRKSFVSQASAIELHNLLLYHYMRDYGAESGWRILEREIDIYMQTGMTRSEALRTTLRT